MCTFKNNHSTFEVRVPHSFYSIHCQVLRYSHFASMGIKRQQRCTLCFTLQQSWRGAVVGKEKDSLSSHLDGNLMRRSSHFSIQHELLQLNQMKRWCLNYIIDMHSFQNVFCISLIHLVFVTFHHIPWECLFYQLFLSLSNRIIS